LSKQPKKKRPRNQVLPPGWDEQRIRRVLEHYENQTEEEAVAEDEAAFQAEGQTVMMFRPKWSPGFAKCLLAVERKSNPDRSIQP